MNPLVSILIPAYNAESWIAQTLESALRQTWLNVEIIVVNDESNDNTLSIARCFKSPKVKVIVQKHRGASAARNRALLESQGDLIQFLDADDLLSPNKIERQLKLWSEAPKDTVFTAEWAMFTKNPELASFNKQALWNDMPPVEWLVCAWQSDLMMHPAAWLVPRAIADRAGLWDETLSMNDDAEYFCRIVLASREVRFCLGAKTFYRSGNPSSLSQSRCRSAWESWYRSLELSAGHLLKVEDSLRTRQACAARFQRFIFEYGPYAPDLEMKATAEVSQLGGTDVKPYGGHLFRFLSWSLGWKRAKAIQVIVYRYGYSI